MKHFFTPLFLCILFHATCSAAPPPNVIIVLTDDQGYADVGRFGAKGFATPNLDRLAKEGVRFTDFHVSTAVCSASRAALLTGCYHSRVSIHGALSPSDKHGLNPNEMTIAEVLKQKGYATGMAGKWHLGHLPQFLPVRQGFDEYFGLPYSNDMWPYHPEAKKGTYPSLPLIEGDQVIDAEVTPEKQSHLTTWYTERAVAFIEKNKDRPFFFYLAHSMPHVPLFVSEKFKGKSKLGLYGDVIMEIDWSVGEILKALRQHGLEDNTLVIFTSDNGPWLSYGNHAGSAGPLREGKGTSWEGGTRVPFIARWPGRIPAGKVQEQPAMTIDLLPTLATLASAPLPPLKIDGLDIWPLLACEKGARSPHPAYFTWYANNQLEAVRSGDWKLILPHNYRTLEGRPGGREGIPAKYGGRDVLEPELYNITRDRSEHRNVAARNSAVVQRLLAFAEQARAELGDSLTKRQGTGVREAGSVSPSPSNGAAGWQLLFDGQNTDQWRGFNQLGFPTNVWNVENGCLHVRPHAGGGDLVSTRKFANFELAWEWRIGFGGNSGLKYLINDEHGSVGPEYQMIDDPHAEDGTRGPKHATGSLYDVLGSSNVVVKPLSEYNQSRLLLNGNHVEHWLNGTMVLSYEMGSDSLKTAIAASKFKNKDFYGVKVPGRILLQNHGAEVWFRNLKIREIP